MPPLRRPFTPALCGSAVICLAASFVSFLTASASFAQNVEDGRAVFAERRIRAYTYLGADEDIIRMTLPRITRQEGNAPGSWVYEWRTIGEHYEALGDAATNRRAAIDAFMKAGVYYAIAWFPRITDAEQDQAYRAQLRAYQKGGKLFDVPLEIVKVPFKDGELITYLHRPPGVEKPPLVIYSGGVDQYKANHYRPIQDYLAKGLAVATFDMPGFGESRQWPQVQSPESHVAIMEHYMKRGDIDAKHISFFGQSYGGGAALRVALLNDPRITAVVAMCAGIRSRTGKSLVDEGKIGKGKTITTPLLVVNGSRDPGNPVSDMRMTYESAAESDLWVLGLGEHCAVEYYPVVMPHVAQWLVEKIDKSNQK
jgi:dienelactone hydrolase